MKYSSNTKIQWQKFIQMLAVVNYACIKSESISAWLASVVSLLCTSMD